MLKGLNHVGLAVSDLEAAIATYSAAFGISEWERIELPERHMAVAVCRIGATLIELIAPTSDDAAFAKFLRERGEGVHHLAFEVDDVNAELSELGQRGVRLIDSEGRPGIHDTCVGFLHPKALHGVLVELVERTVHE